MGLPLGGDRLWWCGLGGRLSLAVPQPLAPARVQSTIVRRVVASPDMWLIASKSQLEKHEDDVNKFGAKLAPHPRGKRCRAQDYSSPLAQCRLEDHQRNAVDVRSKDVELYGVNFL